MNASNTTHPPDQFPDDLLLRFAMWPAYKQRQFLTWLEKQARVQVLPGGAAAPMTEAERIAQHNTLCVLKGGRP